MHTHSNRNPLLFLQQFIVWLVIYLWHNLRIYYTLNNYKKNFGLFFFSFWVYRIEMPMHTQSRHQWFFFLRLCLSHMKYSRKSEALFLLQNSLLFAYSKIHFCLLSNYRLTLNALDINQVLCNFPLVWLICCLFMLGEYLLAGHNDAIMLLRAQWFIQITPIDLSAFSEDYGMAFVSLHLSLARLVLASRLGSSCKTTDAVQKF